MHVLLLDESLLGTLGMGFVVFRFVLLCFALFIFCLFVCLFVFVFAFQKLIISAETFKSVKSFSFL